MRRPLWRMLWRSLSRAALAIAAGLLAAVLLRVMHALPDAPVDLRLLVQEQIPVSGVDHPVTAVLLNFRGYDTLLEIGVLLLAVLALLSVKQDSGALPAAPADPVPQALARLVAPTAVLIGIYLLWAGAFRPGGAFQAGALLAAAAVMLNLTGLQPGWRMPGAWLRAGLVVGLMVFLAIAALLLARGTLLGYPPDAAGALILLIESGLTLSIGCLLAGLFLFLSVDTGGDA